jgi:hypothetical protein
MSQNQTADTASSIDNLIYDPTESVRDMTDYITNAREMLDAGLGLHFPIQSIADSFPIPPALPGKVVTIGAQSHNGKTMFMNFWRDDAVRRIRAANRTQDIIISVIAEDMVEEAMAVALSKLADTMENRGHVETRDGLLSVATKLYGVPIYFIGYSLSRPNSTAETNMTSVEKAAKRIIEKRKDQDKETVVQALLVDYLQVLPLDREIMGAVVDKRRNLQVAADMQAMRRIARRLPCPVVAASQAKEELKHAPGANMQTPGLLDMGETKVIGDHTDSNFGLWMPKTTHPYGEVIEHGKTKPLQFRVVENLMWIRCNKQRGIEPRSLRSLPANRAWPLKINFADGSFTEWSAPGTLDAMYTTIFQKEQNHRTNI